MYLGTHIAIGIHQLHYVRNRSCRLMCSCIVRRCNSYNSFPSSLQMASESGQHEFSKTSTPCTAPTSYSCSYAVNNSSTSLQTALHTFQPSLLSPRDVVDDSQYSASCTLKCRNCGYQSSSHAELVTHMHTHQQYRPFQCHLCFQTFRQKITLKRHILTHTGEKPFQCLVCSYKARLKFHLDNHTRRMHPESFSPKN